MAIPIHKVADAGSSEAKKRKETRSHRGDGMGLYGQGYPGLELNGTKSVQDLIFVEERAE